MTSSYYVYILFMTCIYLQNFDYTTNDIYLTTIIILIFIYYTLYTMYDRL